MGSLISLTLWRSTNGVRCELVERRAQHSFEVRLLCHTQVLNATQVPDTDTAYRVATDWRSKHTASSPIVTPPKAA